MPHEPSLLEFVARWQASTLTEKSAAQTHFIELCQVLGKPWPTPGNALSVVYAFEKGVEKTGGGKGFADVWLSGHFAWEYKGRGKDLGAAYRQLLEYKEALENPPLLVVCDLDRFEVHTNFTNTVKQVYAFTLSDLLTAVPTPNCPKPPLEVLRALWDDPDSLKPERTTEQVTELAAAEFARLAESLRSRGEDPEAASRFLIRLLFCLFAEDVGLLPVGLFTRLVANLRNRPAMFTGSLQTLFGAMAEGGVFGADVIAHFNGGLFTDDETLELGRADLETLERACRLDWHSIEPAIFGTLFERSLDPAKRSQLGAHYTGRDDIGLIVEPVLMAPLRRRWDEVQERADALVARRDALSRGAQRTRAEAELQRLLVEFAGEIAGVRVLDPACGSGNFLYVALKELLDLEKEVVTYAARSGVGAFFPQVEPGQLFGIELDPYAHELAQVSVWIGYIQWLRDNGFGVPGDPILKPLENIRQMDAILAFDEHGRPYEPEWPEADVIIGNPPFLGGKRLRSELGAEYMDKLFAVYDRHLPRNSDLVCYWFEHARRLIERRQTCRVGLLATNSIRQQQNRPVLDAIKCTGDIFMAWSDRPWVLEGAAVRVSMIGFDDGTEVPRHVDGEIVSSINSDLTGTVDLTMAIPLMENAGICVRASEKGGPFELPSDEAHMMLQSPYNINSRSNADVLRPWATAIDILRRPRGMWIIDFGVGTSVEIASEFERPFAYAYRHIYPERQQNSEPRTRQHWWLHRRSAVDMRVAVANLGRFIVTPVTAKHRVFVWLSQPTLPDITLTVFAREDDYFFGVLHARPHELWSLRMGTTLEDRPRYTPTTCFETYPFPWPPGKEPEGDPRVEAIAEAARELVERRDRWLNPEGASEAELKKRTLTNLYNERPTWLALAHERLDHAVLDAYNWPHEVSDEELLERLLGLNLERSGQKEIKAIGAV